MNRRGSLQMLNGLAEALPASGVARPTAATDGEIR
jgi:hypothetical protein